MITNENGGTMLRNGNLIYDTTRGVNMSLYKSGHSYLSENGCAFYKNGILSANENIISINNNVAFRSDGLSYKFEGATVKCDDGRIWNNVKTQEDFLDILALELVYQERIASGQ